MPGTSETHRRPMAVSRLAGRPRPGAGSVGNAVRLVLAVRSRRLASAGPARQWRDRVAAQARGRGEESREPGVTVRIGSITPVWAGNPWRAVKIGRSNRCGNITYLSLPPQCGDRLRLTAQPMARMAEWQQENWTQRDSAGRHGT